MSNSEEHFLNASTYQKECYISNFTTHSESEIKYDQTYEDESMNVPCKKMKIESNRYCFDELKDENSLPKEDDSTTCNSNNSTNCSSSFEKEKISDIYNKIVEKFDEKPLTEDNNVHIFYQCNVCRKNYRSLSLPIIEASKLIKSCYPTEICQITEENSTLISNNIQIIKRAASPYEVIFLNCNQCEECKCNESKPNIDKILPEPFKTSNKLNEMNIILLTAKLKVQKCFVKLMDLSELLFNVRNNNLNKSDCCLNERNYNESNLYEDNDNLNIIKLKTKLQLESMDDENNINVKEELLKNIIAMHENFIITENFPFTICFMKKLVEQMKKENLDVTDINSIQEISKEISDILISLNCPIDEDCDSVTVDSLNSSKFYEENENSENKQTREEYRSGNTDCDSDASISTDTSNITIISDCENESIRIPSPPQKDFFLTHTKINRADFKQIYVMAHRMNFGISTKYVENVTTHLIVPNKWYDKTLCYPFLAAVAHQSFIVTFQWIAECLHFNRILPIDAYIPNQSGALTCLQKNRKPLFHGYSIFFHKTEELVSKKQNEHLAATCGASIICNKQSSSFKGKRILISSKRDPPSELLWECLDLKIYPVHTRWLHDSISKYEVQPLKSYCLVNGSDEMLDYFLNETF